MQEIVRLTGALSLTPSTNVADPLIEGSQMSSAQVIGQVKAVFCCLTIAMKYEPASAHQFATEVHYLRKFNLTMFKTLLN